jgi:adenine-specific DNA-methyltransferase
MTEDILTLVKNTLKRDERLISEDTLLKNKIMELTYKQDEDLIELLLSEAKVKEYFFTEVNSTLIFDKDKFVKFINNKEFLPDSYTTFKNKIGLIDENDEYIDKKKEVSLAWPYKDCILEGDQADPDEDRDEIFWNEILAPDEVDRLLEPKVLTNGRRVDRDVEHEFDEFNRQQDGTISDNLMVKGNNLLVLHSLKKEFAGKVDLIYIDPPYNPDNKNNTFTYNNRFNHSTWLTFMKNRLEVAKQLLAEEGVLQIAIDENEHARLGVLLDDIFPRYEKHCITIAHNPRGVQGKNFSYSNEFVYFLFKKGLKAINKLKRENPLKEEFKDHGGESLRTDAKNCFYPILVKEEEIIGFGDVPDESFHPEGKNVKRDNGIIEVWPIDVKGKERKWVFARQTVEEIKEKLYVKNKNNEKIDIFRIKDEKKPRTVWTGERYDASTHGSKIVNKVIEGKTVSFPKSIYAVYDCLYSVVKNKKEALVLDFFAGSGTTASALLKLNKEDGGKRRFILVEQLEEHVQVMKERIKQQLDEENCKTSFIYTEIKQQNKCFMEKIKKANSKKQLKEIWNKMKEDSFLSYKVDPNKVAENIDEFKNLSLENKKKFLFESLDKNHLYVNLSEIEDEEYNISQRDKELNRQFYEGDLNV